MKKKIDEKISAKQLLIIGIIYIIYITYTNKYYSYFGSKYILDSIFITILGLILCVYISKYLLSNKRIIISKYLIYIGSNTLLYFIFHGKIISITQFLFSKIHNYINLENFYIEQTIGILITIITAIIAVIPIFIVQKYMPKTIGKGFKLWQ